MEQFILWFNIFSFSLLLTSLGVSYSVFGHKNAWWPGSYYLYLVTYGLFTLSQTYRYFSLVYVHTALPVLDTVNALLSTLTAVMLILAVPRFVQKVCPRRVTRTLQILHLAAVVLFILLLVLSFFRDFIMTRGIGGVYFNTVLALFTAYGWTCLRNEGDDAARGFLLPFLTLTGICYTLVALILVFSRGLLFFALDENINALSPGIICFLWGVVSLLSLFRLNRQQKAVLPGALSPRFVEEYSITPREGEIITLLLKGMSHKEIAEALFVSPRTVEAHTYNIYRKCSVKNKLALAHLMLNESVL